MKPDYDHETANENIDRREVALAGLDQLAQAARAQYEAGILDAAGLATALNYIAEVRAAVLAGDRERLEALKP